MYVKKIDINVIAVGTSPIICTETVGPIQGRLLSIIYIEDGSNPYPGLATSPTSDFDITVITDDTSQTLWAESAITTSVVVNPRQYLVDYSNTPVESSVAVGSPPTSYYLWDFFYIADETITITCTNPTAGQTGRFIILVG